MPKTSIMHLLKSATQDDHDEIERRLNLFDPAYTRESYRDLLIRLYGYYFPWEQSCHSMLGDHSTGLLQSRLKTPLLEQDLSSLGYRDLNAIPRCTILPSMRTLAEALGSMYVIEGSTLGGRFLARHFAGALGIQPETGGRFFAGYQDRTGEMWKEFGQIVDAQVSLDAAPQAIESARLTFHTMGDWLAEMNLAVTGDNRVS